MKQTTLRYVVDTILAVSIFGIIFIGALLGFVLPEGPAQSEDAKYFLGLHRHSWGDIHLYLGVAFTAALIIHLILEWTWIKGKTRQLFQEKWRAVLAAIPVLALVVLGGFWWALSLDSQKYADYGLVGGAEQEQPLSLQEGEALVTGQMTLSDLEANTGIAADNIARELQVPPGVSKDETLGRLKKKQTFTMDEVRDVVTDLSLVTAPADAVERRQDEHVDRDHHEEPQLTRGRNAEDPSGILITGQMSLREIERRTGVSARRIIERLGLPRNAPLDEWLGRLRKVYNFTLQDVRDAVASLTEAAESHLD